MWSTVTSTPFCVPQSFAYLSNQVSYVGTKWLHCMILSDFCWRLIRMVGPSATAAAAAPAVVTNSRRSILFRLVIALPSIHSERRLAAKRGASPRREKWLLSERVHNAQGDLTRVLLTGRRP